MYQHGFGVARNSKLAPAYYDQGYAPAEFNLGAAYESGNYGVKRDYKQAFAWYRKAADQNWSDAEREVAYFYQCDLRSNGTFARPWPGTAWLPPREMYTARTIFKLSVTNSKTAETKSVNPAMRRSMMLPFGR